jgi:hypothetical protein
MHVNKGVLAAVAGVAAVIPAVIAVAGSGSSHGSGHASPAVGLVREVREATVAFRDVAAAEAAGYASMGSCVSGPQEGAMGVHYVNGPLVGDGALDARRPEVVMYEQRSGRLRLVGVEFIVIAADWHANNPGPPVLLGQHFNYVGSPNRYGLPAFYELHVWAWKDNPGGMFVDWNPNVSCEEFVSEGGHSGSHGGGH